MKIRKSTIVWFVLSVLLAASQAVEIDNSDGVTWADATYVKDAKVLARRMKENSWWSQAIRKCWRLP